MDNQPRLPANDRLPPIPEGDRTPEQQASIDKIVAGPRGMFGGPFVPLLRSPAILDHVQQIGAYLRWNSEVSAKLRELAMLVVVRRWEQPNEFNSHAGLGMKAGLSEQLVRDIAEQRRPSGPDDEMAVYDFIDELLETKAVGDANYGRLLALLGEKGVMDILGICSYYVGLAMVMNTARTPTPPGLIPYSMPKA